MKHRQRLVLAALALLASLALFELTPIDLWVQRLFFDQSSQQWIWDRAEPLSKFIFYDGIKKAIILLGLCTAATLAFAKRSTLAQERTQGFRSVIFALMTVPACVGLLKSTTNVACPRNLTEFGGALSYVRVFQHYPATGQPMTRQKCFPAGHASGGFALISLAYLFGTTRNRRAALAVALTVGWSMGIYKMIIGDHFLSHTVVTMLLAWLIIELIVLVDEYVNSGIKG